MILDTPSFVSGMKRLSESYPHAAALTDANVAAYEEGLSDIPGEDFVAATRAVVQSSKYFPSIAEIREFAIPIGEARRRGLRAAKYKTGDEEIQ